MIDVMKENKDSNSNKEAKKIYTPKRKTDSMFCKTEIKEQ